MRSYIVVGHKGPKYYLDHFLVSNSREARAAFDSLHPLSQIVICQVDEARTLIETFVGSDWGERFENDEPINGADFVEYGGELYRDAKKVVENG